MRTFPPRLATHALSAVLFLVGASPAARAATLAEAPAGTPPKAAGPAPEGQAPSAEPENPAAQPPPPPGSIVERLPDSAYPEPLTRGLPYGSLWLTFHGLQWPYLPAAGDGSRFVIGISGWGWVDTSYEKFSPWGSNQNLGEDQVKYLRQQARLVLRVTPTYSLGSGWFVQGQAELVATEDQTENRTAPPTGAFNDTDDLWLRIGQWDKWDFTIGRYEGWEVFHLGMGLDLNTFEREGAFGPGDIYNPVFYGVTDNQYRPQGSLGNAAIHYYPARYLRFELLGVAGTTSNYPLFATRPVAIFDLGWLKLKGAAEYTRVTSWTPGDLTSQTKKGIGGGIEFVFLPHIEFGFSAAQGTIWSVDRTGDVDLTGSLTRTSMGGFLNVSNGSARHPLIFGAGSVYTHNVDINTQYSTQVDDYWQLQSFVAVQYVALEQLYIKLVAGYARGHWNVDAPGGPEVYDDEMYSLRLRLSLYF
jgi:hypothetical protein